MNKTTKKLKKVEKKIAKLLPWSLKKYHFLGDMHDGSLTIVVVAKEK